MRKTDRQVGRKNSQMQEGKEISGGGCPKSFQNALPLSNHPSDYDQTKGTAVVNHVLPAIARNPRHTLAPHPPTIIISAHAPHNQVP